MTRDKSRFYSLEFCRGLAATLVVFHHTANIMSQPRFLGAQPFDGLFLNFNVGVDFFFVLSGFIITWVHAADIGVSEKLKPFVLRRFTRIYPPYWGVLFPLILLYIVVPSAGVPSQHDPLNIITSILLLPWKYAPVLGVAWTLVREVIFYTLFGFALVIGRRALVIFPLWALLIIGANIFAGDMTKNVLLDPFDIEFVFGMVAAGILLKYRVPKPLLFIIVGGCVFLFAMLFLRHLQDVPLRARLVYGTASTIALLGMVEFERSRGLVANFFVKIFGGASYSIYLVHPVVLSFGIQALTRFMPKEWPAVYVISLACFGVSLGILYHLVIEKPLTRVVRNWL